MKKTNLYLASLLLATLVAVPSCKEDKDTPAPIEQKISYQLVTPSTTDSIAAEELTALRELFSRNDLEKAVASATPQSWDTRQLAVNFLKGEDGKYHVAELLTGTQGFSDVKALNVLTSETFPELRNIDLIAPKLEDVTLRNLPKLTKLKLVGTYQSTAAPLTKLSYETLESLESVSIKDFPNLTTTNNDNGAFKIPVEYRTASGDGADRLPKLALLELSNLPAIVDLYIEPFSAKLSQGVKLEKLSKLDLLKVTHTKLSNLSFQSEDFPKLRYLTLHHIEDGSASALAVKGLSELETLDLTSAASVTTASVTDCAKLKALTLSRTKVAKPELSNLPALTRVDLAGNEISAIDLSAFTQVTSVALGHNLITNFSESKLPSSVQTLGLSGNEGLTDLDLSPYQELTHVDCFGLKRGATDQDHSAPGKLASVNVKGLKKLESLRLPNNSLEGVFVEGQTYPVLESLDLSYNQLTPAGFAWIYAIVGEKAGKSPKLKLKHNVFVGQRPFAVTLDKDDNYSYKAVVDALTAAGFDDPFMIKEYILVEFREAGIFTQNLSDFTGDGIDETNYLWSFSKNNRLDTGWRFQVDFAGLYAGRFGDILKDDKLTSQHFKVQTR